MTLPDREPPGVLERFHQCRRRQFRGTVLALFLVLLLAAVYKYPDFFGEYLKASLFAGECLVVAGYIGFTAANWRCPSCVRYLGADIMIARCPRCGERLR